MIKIYVKFVINSGAESPKKLVDRLRRIGGTPLIGEHDVEIPLDENERLFHKLEAVHRALKGSGAYYSVSTGIEGIGRVANDVPYLDQRKNLEIRKKFYRAKLARWKEMGIDTAVLEELLDKDLDKFKEISKAYIREHLERGKVVEGSPRDLKQVDEMILEAVDDLGVSLTSICKMCELSEKEVMMSLGRLISTGKVRRNVKGEKEIYIRAVRKRGGATPSVDITPAKSEAESIQRVLSAIRTKGSTVKQICRDSRLPEGQVMDALAELLKSKRLRSAKRGRGSVYLRVPGK
jgi:hypothetical protein